MLDQEEHAEFGEPGEGVAVGRKPAHRTCRLTTSRISLISRISSALSCAAMYDRSLVSGHQAAGGH